MATRPHRYQTRPLRVWDKIHALTTRTVTGCWVYGGTLQSAGYGHIYVGGKNYKKELVHRLSWRKHRGLIPDGKCVLHRCDNPPCWRPSHLFLGTKGDNNRDCATKGRNARGERSAMAKLTEADVIAIRSVALPGTEIATRFGISRAQVSGIRSRKFWRHI